MAQAELLFNQMAQSPQEEEYMWIPNLKTGHAVVVAALSLTTSLSAAPATDKFAIGFCKTARQTFPAEISPIYDGQAYLEKYQREMLKDNVFEGAKVSLLVRPKHGAIEYQDDRLAVENSWYHYRPQAGFEGTDRLVMQVEKSGIKVKIYYVIKALDDVEATAGYCPKEFWKISQSDFNSGNKTTPPGSNFLSSPASSPTPTNPLQASKTWLALPSAPRPVRALTPPLP